MRNFRSLVKCILASTVLMSPGLSVAAPAAAGSGGVQSRNYSGYAVSGAPGSVSHVAGSWKVPGAACGRSHDGYALFWVGIDGLDLPGSRAGGAGEGVGTELECSNGIASYYAWYQLSSGATVVPLAVKAGDEVSAAVNYTGGQFTAKITNERTGESFTTSAEVSGAPRSTAEWLVGAPVNQAGTVERLANFGTALHGYDHTGLVNTSEATIGGATGPISKFAATRITMVDSKGAKLVVPSALSPDGTSFSVTSGAKPATASFVIVHAPSSAKITPGSSATFTISSASSGGFDSAIALSASALPSGATATFHPASVPAPGNGSSTMTISTSSSTPAGTYIITLTGAGGGLTSTTNVSLTVASSTTPTFTLASNPSIVYVMPGASTLVTISSQVYFGFNADVALSAAGQPTGTTISFTPSSIPAPGSGSSNMMISTSSSTPMGTYNIIVTGAGGGVTATTGVSLTVANNTTPVFAITASPKAVELTPGSSAAFTVSTKISKSFNAAIALSASGQPAGVTVSFHPASIPAPGAGSSIMTLTTSSTTPIGTYIIAVTGVGGGFTATTGVALTVVTSTAPFAITPSPKSVKVTPGTTTTFAVSTAISKAFNSAIALTASGQPAGMMVSFNPAIIPAPGAGSSTMTVSVGSSTAFGTYILTVTGTGGGVTETAQVSVSVVKTTSPGFTISASPHAIQVARGSSGVVAISTTVFNGFNSAVALSAAGQPTGATVSFNPAGIPAPGAGSSTMTIAVDPSLATGTYIITVTGAGGGVSNSAFVFLTVTQ